MNFPQLVAGFLSVKGRLQNLVVGNALGTRSRLHLAKMGASCNLALQPESFRREQEPRQLQ